MSKESERTEKSSEKDKIIVAGDVTLDWLHWEDDDKHSQENWREGYDQYNIESLNGGALLLADILRLSFNYDNIITHKKICSSSKILNSMCVLERYDKTKENPEPYRVKQFFGFRGPENVEIPALNFHNFEGHARIIVIVDDSGNRFRGKEYENSWNQIEKCIGPDTYFIHKISRFLSYEDISKVWDKIEDKNNLIVIITAEDLRNSGLRISRSLSWERTAYDFLKEMEKIPEKIENNKDQNSDVLMLKKLYDCQNLIVRFGVDGAILYQNNNSMKKYTLFFDPKFFEGDIEQKYPGKMQGFGSAFVSGLIHEYQKDQILENGIKKGIVACREIQKIGFIKRNEISVNYKKMNYPFKNIQNVIEGPEFKSIEQCTYEKEGWKIIDNIIGTDQDKIYQTACQIVRYGESDNLRVPIAKFNKLSTADRSEIESFQSIKNLINEYIHKKTNIPLSIAVFGPPGTGKSFAVKQIAKTIRKDIEPLEFNLSQFQSPKDLFNAFHIVQSTVLDGKIPLVFFDEFDSKLNGDNFAWLKYFLAPMNDGKFKTGDTIHPIGKCIFVFAGGTKKTFDEFNKDKTKDKGSDFVSRLRGHVDIEGINKKPGRNKKYSNEGKYLNIKLRNILKIRVYPPKIRIYPSEEEDNHYMIRRAFVLRNILEKNAKNIFKCSNGRKEAHIDNSVLNALIEVPKYEHGVRSMEAIIEMSMLSNKKRFDRSALPPNEQSRLHVNVTTLKHYLDHPRKTCIE
nr:AAA family ATPase [uncultured Methanobacterium sp.]